MEDNINVNNGGKPADLIADDSFITSHYEYASQGQRFLNWLIDNLFMRYALSIATGFTIGAILGLIAPDFINRVAYDSSFNRYSGSLILLAFLIGYLNYIFYYTLCEKLFRGYTLGKLITGTRAIRQDGGELTFKDALLRSLSRCVPFEVFSGFNTLTWHDSWTNTMVVKAR